jgi:hypothetical protein
MQNSAQINDCVMMLTVRKLFEARSKLSLAVNLL